MRSQGSVTDELHNGVFQGPAPGSRGACRGEGQIQTQRILGRVQRASTLRIFGAGKALSLPPYPGVWNSDAGMDGLRADSDPTVTGAGPGEDPRSGPTIKPQNLRCRARSRPLSGVSRAVRHCLRN